MIYQEYKVLMHANSNANFKYVYIYTLYLIFKTLNNIKITTGLLHF
jgi:hypothetical protein